MEKLIHTSIIAGTLIIPASLGSCQRSKYQLRKAIMSGADPMETACAFDHGLVSDTSMCAIALTKK